MGIFMKLVTTIFACTVLNLLAFNLIAADPGFSIGNNSNEEIRVYVDNENNRVNLGTFLTNSVLKGDYTAGRVQAAGFFSKYYWPYPSGKFNLSNRTFVLILKGNAQGNKEAIKSAINKIAKLKGIPKIAADALILFADNKITAVAEKLNMFLPVCLVSFNTTGKTIYIKYQPGGDKQVLPQEGSGGKTSDGYSLDNNVKPEDINAYCISP